MNFLSQSKFFTRRFAWISVDYAAENQGVLGVSLPLLRRSSPRRWVRLFAPALWFCLGRRAAHEKRLGRG
jgi:hypothetical protein